MKRLITDKIISAFRCHHETKIGHDSVEVRQLSNDFTPFTYLLYRGTAIAKLKDGNLYITSAGFKTRTTKERLNGLPGVNIHQKNFTWFLNGKEWDGEWTKI